MSYAKGPERKLEDSNMENYGSQEHKDLKRAAAEAEPAWVGAGSSIGVEVWRMEKFKVYRFSGHVKPHASNGPRRSDQKELEAKYGEFFTGDSFIILHTYMEEERKLHDVHFWLGAQSTQDEMGTAAYKTVELDDYLGDLPVQYREVEGQESARFLKLFPKGMSVYAGGVESGFNIVEPESYTPRLMHIKGTRKSMTVREVKLESASVNNGDVFLLDKGLELIQWNGPSSGGFEKNKASAVVAEIRDHRNGRPTITVIDGDLSDSRFWMLLGGPVTEVAAPTPDTEVKSTPAVLTEVSDRTGSMEMTQIATGADIKRSMLQADEVYLLDVGTVLYVYVGSGASRAERRDAFKFASSYLEQIGREAHSPVVRVAPGSNYKPFYKHFH
jgi:gelsolin